MLKIKLFFSTLLITSSLISFPQSDYDSQIQLKVREGLDYVLELKQYNPKDLIIVQKINSSKYFEVVRFDDSTIEANELIPPDIDNPKDIVNVIEKDSVFAILWVKKKKFQTINLNTKEIPFTYLKSTFGNETFKEINNDIHEIKAIEYLDNLKVKYPNLMIRHVESIPMMTSEIEGADNLSSPIVYPLEAKYNSTQGHVTIGYVITRAGSVEDVFVFHGLKDGCTEAVLDAINDLSRQLREIEYSGKQDVYVEATINFILQQ